MNGIICGDGIARNVIDLWQTVTLFLTIRGISMEKEITEVYCGNGRGKTTLAIGQALRASSQGKSVIIIQFLKGKELIIAQGCHDPG